MNNGQKVNEHGRSSDWKHNDEIDDAIGPFWPIMWMCNDGINDDPSRNEPL